MSHHIYTTPAIVLESAPGREADRRFALFTREFGIIRASASGVRRSASKLRYALQEFSVLAVSLVRGREYWRVTNASAGENIFWRKRENVAAMEVVARIFRLLLRLAPEEEKNEAFYDVVIAGVRFLTEHEITGENIATFEQVLVLRILRVLGYVAGDTRLTPFLSDSWDLNLLSSARREQKTLLSSINFSLQQSQL